MIKKKITFEVTVTLSYATAHDFVCAVKEYREILRNVKAARKPLWTFHTPVAILKKKPEKGDDNVEANIDLIPVNLK